MVLEVRALLGALLGMMRPESSIGSRGASAAQAMSVFPAAGVPVVCCRQLLPACIHC